ncbi:MAG: Ig-like domain-containing protein [Verrucomicrobiae bacterium]|nr:Ig-like domain-containing protein [Verrucomicrobiae bacterium]NNJ44206.1 hypothetical protein [Akkermansiaceae bacterium]
MTLAEIQNHIQLLIDGEISATEFAALESELLTNSEALEVYLAYGRLHCGLERHCDIRGMVKNPPVVPIHRVLALQRKFAIKVSLLGAAAVLLLTVVGMWFFQAPEQHALQAKFQVAPGTDFALTHDGQTDAPAGKTLVEGSRLILRHGVVELDLPHDVRAVVEAPADMVLRDDRTLELDYGRALFQIRSKDGRGFTVATPHQRIVDLGTSFGIDFPQGREEIELHVLEGRVRIDPQEGSHGEIIQANRAVLLAGAKVLRDIDNSALGFLHSLPSKIDTLVDENFESGFLADQNYVIRMDPTVIRDLAGNPFQGIEDDTTWNFSTPRAISGYAATILADDFADVVKAGNSVTWGAWDSVNGIDAPATSLSFWKGGTTSAASFHRVTDGEIDVNNNMKAAGWDTSWELNLSPSVASIRLTTLEIDLRLINKDGYGQSARGKNSRMLVELVGSVSGLLGKVDPGNSFCPGGEYTRILDLTRLPTLDHSETYTLHLKARGTGLGHHKSLQGMALRGDISVISGSSHSAAASVDSFLGDEAQLGIEAQLGVGDGAEESMSERDDSPPVISALQPADNSISPVLGGQLKMRFNEAIRWGTGRVFIQNVTDWSESTLVVGSRQLSIDGRVLTIHPPATLDDGDRCLGWLAGWESTSPVAFFNPRGDGVRYLHDDLQDDSPAQGMIGSMRSTGMVSIRHAIRREIGTITLGSRYTVSAAVGVRARDARAASTFLGYRIRLSSGGHTLAQLTGNTPPSAANQVNSVGFSWDATILPDGVQPGDPLSIEIIPDHVDYHGDLDLNGLHVTVRLP